MFIFSHFLCDNWCFTLRHFYYISIGVTTIFDSTTMFDTLVQRCMPYYYLIPGGGGSQWSYTVSMNLARQQLWPTLNLARFTCIIDTMADSFRNEFMHSCLRESEPKLGGFFWNWISGKYGTVEFPIKNGPHYMYFIYSSINCWGPPSRIVMLVCSDHICLVW